MKRIFLSTAVMALGVIFISSGWAQTVGSMRQQEREEAEFRESCPMYSLLVGGMLDQSLAVTDDSVYVLLGTDLYKYDKNLNLQKKQELQVDSESIRRLMEEFKISCSIK